LTLTAIPIKFWVLLQGSCSWGTPFSRIAIITCTSTLLAKWALF